MLLLLYRSDRIERCLLEPPPPPGAAVPTNIPSRLQTTPTGGGSVIPPPRPFPLPAVANANLASALHSPPPSHMTVESTQDIPKPPVPIPALKRKTIHFGKILRNNTAVGNQRKFKLGMLGCRLNADALPGSDVFDGK